AVDRVQDQRAARGEARHRDLVPQDRRRVDAEVDVVLPLGQGRLLQVLGSGPVPPEAHADDVVAAVVEDLRQLPHVAGRVREPMDEHDRAAALGAVLHDEGKIVRVAAPHAALVHPVDVLAVERDALLVFLRRLGGLLLYLSGAEGRNGQRESDEEGQGGFIHGANITPLFYKHKPRFRENREQYEGADRMDMALWKFVGASGKLEG